MIFFFPNACFWCFCLRIGYGFFTSAGRVEAPLTPSPSPKDIEGCERKKFFNHEEMSRVGIGRHMLPCILLWKNQTKEKQPFVLTIFLSISRLESHWKWASSPSCFLNENQCFIVTLFYFMYNERRRIIFCQ